jgi:DNA polymerase-1
MIKKLMQKFQSEYIAIVWDSKGKTTRHILYDQYKANRQAAPLDLHSQKESIQKFAELIQLFQLEMPGIEADDLIFSLAIKLAKAGKNVVIVSSDKDMRQILIHENISIFDPFKEIFLTAASCK